VVGIINLLYPLDRLTSTGSARKGDERIKPFDRRVSNAYPLCGES
jgi:hypothetical protein